MGRFSSPLAPDIVTAPEVLRTKGYYTGVCGRYFHLDGVVSPIPVTAQVYEKHNMRTWKNRVDFLDVSSQGPTPKLFDQFLGKVPKGRPWFFWINYNDPHHPWDADAGKVDPGERRLDPSLSATELERQVRALSPAIGAYLEREEGERLGVSAARLTPEDVATGELVAQDGRLLLGTGDGALELLEVTPPGRRPMDAAAYLRGHRMS